MSRIDRTARPSKMTTADRAKLAAPIRSSRPYTLADALRHAAYIVAAVVLASAVYSSPAIRGALAVVIA